MSTLGFFGRSLRLQLAVYAAGFILGGTVIGEAMAQIAYEVDCSKPGEVCREQQTLLPLRALPRPNSNLYNSKADDTSNIKVENVKAFFPVYVFARENLDLSDPSEPKGWYQVGPTVSQPLGWMKAKDIMEWRQALVVSYTHPGTGEDARHPVLMFNDLDALQGVVASPDREEQVEQLYSEVDNGQKPESVISIEPNRFTDIENNFYILPVLDFEVEDRFNDETRLLQIAAAIPQQRSDETNKTTLDNTEFKKEATSEVRLSDTEAQNFTIDIVFVMDLTSSMTPFINQTKVAISDLARVVSQNAAIPGAIKFGLVGYRDNVQMMPEVEFTAKNYTPVLLKDTDFIDMVDKQVRAASVGSGDYAEEVYAGLKLALDEIQWSGGLKFVVLVGDASAHDTGHPQSTTGLSAPELRLLADDQDIYAFAVHLREERAAVDHPIAEQQFGRFTTNPGTEGPALFKVNVTAPDDFDRVVKQIAGQLSGLIAAAKGSGGVDPQTVASGGAQKFISFITQELLGAAANTREAQETNRVINQVAAAALVNYLGGEAVRDITFWSMDRDLIDPDKKSLDVRVLISREDLSDLILSLERIVEAMATAEFTQMKFFESLQAVMSQVAKGQEINFENAQRLSNTSLMPRWIESLPYKSTILDMSDERFEALTPNERADLERNLQSKLQLYRDISENVDAWNPLDERDTGSNRNDVYPLPLAYLP